MDGKRYGGAPVRPDVLVVEDDALMRDSVVAALRADGLVVEAVADGAGFDAAFEALAASPPRLLLLDRGLPDVDGAAIARRVSGRGDIGIVMLTAQGGLDERLHGLQQGADVYLVKPVDPRELVLTVRAVLRRLAALAPPSPPSPSPSLQPASPLTPQPLPSPATQGPAHTLFAFEPRLFRLRAPDGTLVPLNATECALIDRLLREPGEVVAKEALMDALGTHDDAWGEARLMQTVSRLRRKLQTLTPGWTPLRTVSRVGYAFDVGE
jgi:DNA-binding response OmpR family regulator